MIIPIDMNDITGTHATSLMAMPGDGAPHADRPLGCPLDLGILCLWDSGVCALILGIP